MAVFPDRIVLKNSADTDAQIRSAIAVGGADEIQPGEIVLGLGVGNVLLYTRDDSDNIVTFGGNDATSAVNLTDFSIVNPADDEILIYNSASAQWENKAPADFAWKLEYDPVPKASARIQLAPAGLYYVDNTPITFSLLPNLVYGVRIEGASTGYVDIDYTGTDALTLNLPTDGGQNGYALVTDGSGNLSWSGSVSPDVSLTNIEALANVTWSLDYYLNTNNAFGVWDIAPPETVTGGATLNILGDSDGSFGGYGLSMSSSGEVKILNRDGFGFSTGSDSDDKLELTYDGNELIFSSEGIYYYNSRPARSTVNKDPFRGPIGPDQLATFGDIDDSLAAYELGEISNVDMSPSPQDQWALMYDAASGKWIPGVNPGMGTVTSILIEEGPGIVVTDGGPITVTGNPIISLEEVDSGVPGSYVSPTLTVDDYGRITSITSAGGGTGFVTNVNGLTNAVSLGVLDLTDVGGNPGSTATTSPAVDSIWSIQTLGPTAPSGPGHWRAQANGSTSTIVLYEQDGDPANLAGIFTSLEADDNIGTTHYFEVILDEVVFGPFELDSLVFDSSFSSAYLTFQTSDFNVFLINEGDTPTSASGTVSRNCQFRIGIASAFDFGSQAVNDKEVLKYSLSAGEFRPARLELDDLSDVQPAGAANGQALVYNTSQAKWLPGSVNSESHVKEYEFDNNGTTAFRIAGPGLDETVNNPTFYVQRGETVKLISGVGGSHPIDFRDNGVSYNTGMDSALPLAVGATIVWTVPHDAPDELTYICTNHSSMQGIIIIGGGGSSNADLSTTSIDALSDVDTTTSAPTDGQALIWDSSAGEWQPGDAGDVSSVNGQTGVVSLDFSDLDDVTVASESARGSIATFATIDGFNFDIFGGGATDRSLKLGSHGFRIFEGDGTDYALIAAEHDVGVNLISTKDLFNLIGATEETSNMPELRFHSGDGKTTGSYLGFQLPFGFNTDQTYTLPLLDGTNGQALVTDGNGVLSWTDAAGGTDISTESIDALNDVDTSTSGPADGQALVWDSTASQWKPGDVAPDLATTSIDALSDVDTTTATPSTGQALVWNGAFWAPDDVEGGGGSGASTNAIGAQRATISTAASGGVAQFNGAGPWGTLVSVSSDVEAWVVLYSTDAYRTSDASRAFDEDPDPGSGVLAEFLVPPGGIVQATPGATFYNGDTPAADIIYAAVRASDGSNIVANLQLTTYRIATVESVGGFQELSAAASNVLNAATADLEIDGMGESGVLYEIDVTTQAWVTVYNSAANRTADSGRSQGTDPGTDAGVIAEIVTAASGSETITPAPGYALPAQDGKVYIAARNLSGSTQNITVTLKAYVNVQSSGAIGLDGGTFGSG